MKVILSGHIEVPLNELEGFTELLVDHIKMTRDEPGCIGFSVKQRAKDSGIFDVHEEFSDSQAFHAHQERVGSSTWGAFTKNVKRVYQIEGLEQE